MQTITFVVGCVENVRRAGRFPLCKYREAREQANRLSFIPTTPVRDYRPASQFQ